MMKTLSLNNVRPMNRRSTAAALPAMIQRFRYRSALRRLIETSPHLIPDIGLSASEARIEAAKPFWQE